MSGEEAKAYANRLREAAARARELARAIGSTNSFEDVIAWVADIAGTATGNIALAILGVVPTGINI